MNLHRAFGLVLGFAAWSAAAAVAADTLPGRRVLAISAPAVSDEAYRTQAALLVAEWPGLIERDFVVKATFGAPAFSVVLIGKDGGEKLRRDTPLAPKELFAIVDAMPMRRAEMKSKDKPSG